MRLGMDKVGAIWFEGGATRGRECKDEDEEGPRGENGDNEAAVVPVGIL
jgi:hypothetical protein